VLLVDDHRGVLDRVSSLLSDDFDVVGLFTDGGQAVDAAPTLAPDVIVLDINMPGLDGFNAAGAIALENQWNAYTHDRPHVTLLCGYATSCFHNGAADVWSSVCAEHWAVSQASDL
jgi:CheY-like chemotaxis protein